MKLLTLNTHSLMEKDYEKKLNTFVNAVVKHEIYVVALQEVMQPISARKSGYPCINAGYIPLKEGNHALNVVRALLEKGEKYQLVWLGFKKSYDRFDEGLAILTRETVEKVKAVNLTPFDEYENWRTRKALGARIGSKWFFSVHMGWWESFAYEFNQLKESLPQNETCWLMGDFNSPASERDKGYDTVIKRGLYDTYIMAKNKDEGFTANTKIDGWHKENNEKIRIDYIFTTEKTEIKSSFVIFNGSNEDIVSDHFGILVDMEEK